MKKRALLWIVFFLVGGVSGYVIGHLGKTRVVQVAGGSEILRENSSEYKFINPILLAQTNNAIKSPQYEPLEAEINSYIDQAKQSKQATDISVYFKQMDSGAWTGVNENDKYAPGSMLKVAVMIAYLNAQDTNPGILDTVYSYDPQIDEGQYFKPPTMLKAGKYTVRDLIKNMIIESDNTATIILANQHPELIDGVYKELQLPSATSVVDDYMSPLQYASLWRVLYNSTYLSKPVSEEALELLSYTTFNDGLVSGLPDGTRIAHKFGEHTDVLPNVPPVHELHDCGIVYPDLTNPYFLCVMTRGADFPSLEKAISDISKMVYQSVTK